MEAYLIKCENGKIVSLQETLSLKTLLDIPCKKITVYRIGELEKVLEADKNVLIALARNVVKDSTVLKEHQQTKTAKCIAVVFDQMYKGFAELVAREIGEVSDIVIEYHEIVGRGLEKPVKIGNVYKQPARDDYDVFKLLKSLSEQCNVVFFTGDKKLANQCMMIKGVHVHYMPPGEYGGKEFVVERMVEILRQALSQPLAV